MKTILRLILVVMVIPFATSQAAMAQEIAEPMPALADVQGVEITMLAWGEVNLYPVTDREVQGESILTFKRHQLPPGEYVPISAREGDENLPAAGIAYVEYGTAMVKDWLGSDQSISAPGVILDSTQVTNQSLDCAWILEATHYHRPPQAGGAFTDAQSLLLPTSVPCDQPQTLLGDLFLPTETAPGSGVMFIAEIEIEPGFNLSGHSEDGFVGIAVERGSLAIQPDIRLSEPEPEATAYLLEGSDYAIQADADDGATGLMYGFLRTETADGADTSLALHHRIQHKGFAYSKQRYTELH